VDVQSCISIALGCGNGFDQAVKDGISLWDWVHDLLGIQVEFVPGLTPNEVTVVWDDGTGSSGYGVAPGVIGYSAIASPPADPSRFIVMTTRCNICPGLPSHTTQDIYLITVHEWGHMLGVWNHSFDPADLMYPFFQGNAAITNRDISTMLKSYSIAPALDLSGLPPNSLTATPGTGGDLQGSAAFDPAHLVIRFLHSYGEPRTTTLEFHPPAP
jgi:hypothetical protein